MRVIWKQVKHFQSAERKLLWNQVQPKGRNMNDFMNLIALGAAHVSPDADAPTDTLHAVIQRNNFQ